MEHPFGCDPDCMGTLDVDGFSLNTWGWMVQNLSRLWFEAEVRGDNRTVPRVAGATGYPRYLDETRVSLVLWVTGFYNSAGGLNANPWTGMVANLDALWTNVCSPVTSGDGSRPCTLTLPNGVTTRTANVQWDPLSRSSDIEDSLLTEFRLTGTILDGRFT